MLAWNKLICGLAMITHSLPDKDLDAVMSLMIDCMYIDYNTSKTYQAEVEKTCLSCKQALRS